MESSENERKRPLSLARPGRLELRKTIETGQVKQSFSHGRSKTVMVEVRRKRTYAPGPGDRMAEVKEEERREQAETGTDESAGSRIAAEARASIHTLTAEERAARARAVRGALATEEEETRRRGEQEVHKRARDDAQRLVDEAAAEEAGRGAEEKEPGAEQARRPDEEQRKRDEETRRKAEEEARRAGEEARRRTEEEVRRRTDERVATRLGEREEGAVAEEEAPRPGRGAVRRPPPVRRVEPRRRTGRLTVVEALREPDQDERVRSLAAVRRARERERLKTRSAADEAPAKVIRDVVIPETITVQELANRMAERSADVIRALMNMGVMATINHVIDADTAELVVAEFGHHHTRVAESDVEIGLTGEEDEATVLESRPPIVTIMGHVDHGKTTLLDALRETDVASGEAGGITQHIGASQVTLESGRKITFIDTPGHEAFTAMRARGAKVTDIVVLVVAADDGVQPQTVEAINHARAAHVPIVLAINKIDRSEADPLRVRNDLLKYGIVSEQMGGDVQSVEVSATKRLNLDKLEEAILLQAEILELGANPNRAAVGTVIESKLEKGRGPVATVLVQRGTVRVGDIFVAGGEWGRVRALLDDRGSMIDSAGPSTPVEVIGLDGTPDAGDDFAVVDSESRARDVAEFRRRKRRTARVAVSARGTVEEIFSDMAEGKASVLPVVIKADVQGSVEAIAGALEKLSTGEVAVRVLHSGVGAINESDVALAKSSNGLIIGFNVRAIAQAREIARRDAVEIRYYSIIYNVVDDAKALLTGMLKPSVREEVIGSAEVREVFTVSKVGRVAGCRVTNGVIRRSGRMRLLRDNVVVHDGTLRSLKHFKEDVREVKEGSECGMAFENYQDVQKGDVVECYETEEVARAL